MKSKRLMAFTIERLSSSQEKKKKTTRMAKPSMSMKPCALGAPSSKRSEKPKTISSASAKECEMKVLIKMFNFELTSFDKRHLKGENE